MHPIFANIQPYLDDVEEETSMLNGACERATSVPSASRDAVERWIYVNAIASGIEKVYTGIEKALDRIVRALDGHTPDGPDWHAHLLRRLSVDLPGRRPAVLSPETYRSLDDLRAFRHRERNSSVRDLNEQRVLEIASGIPSTLRMLNEDIARLRQNLDEAG
jgi:hypothetical protein